MLAPASTALSEKHQPQVQPHAPDRLECGPVEAHHALAEQGQRHAAQRPGQLRHVVGVRDRLREHEQDHADHARGGDLQLQAVGHHRRRRGPRSSAVLGDEARGGLRDAEVGGQEHERGDAQREREDAVVLGAQDPHQDDGEHRGEARRRDLGGEREGRVARDRVGAVPGARRAEARVRGRPPDGDRVDRCRVHGRRRPLSCCGETSCTSRARARSTAAPGKPAPRRRRSASRAHHGSTIGCSQARC